MNTRNHLFGLVMGILVLASCRTLEAPSPVALADALPDSTTEAPAEREADRAPERVVDGPVVRAQERAPERTVERMVERTAHLTASIARPYPPLAEPLEFGGALPVPEVTVSVVHVPYWPNRNLEFNLAPSSRPGRATVRVFGPSSRALAAAERPPVSGKAEPSADLVEPVEPAEPAGQTVAKLSQKPAVVPSAPAARTAAAPQPPVPRSEPVRQQTEVEAVRRELVARKGDPIAVDLEGSGWIYTGLRNRGVADTGEDPGIDFLSRRDSQNRTSFNFKAVDYGDYELAFQYQDHREAVQRNQVVRLRVVPEQEFDATVQRQAAAQQQQSGSYVRSENTAAGFQPVPGPPIRSADALFDLGEYELALIEYERNMRAGDPYLNDRMARCYEQTGRYRTAVKYYRENLGLEGEYGERAALGLVRSSIATEDSPLLLEVLPSLFGLESVQIGDELLAVARFQAEDLRLSVAIRALEQYIRRYPDGKKLDEVYFRLAEIYEVDSPYRDLESARHYYGLIYEMFPESLFADPATVRLHYLDRHFFLVQ